MLISSQFYATLFLYFCVPESFPCCVPVCVRLYTCRETTIRTLEQTITVSTSHAQIYLLGIAHVERLCFTYMQVVVATGNLQNAGGSPEA